MEELLHWRFVLFGLAFAGLVYLQFLLAHRQWRRLKGEQATDIDLEYVKVEDCLPKSFRAKVKEWLLLASPAEANGAERIIPKGREQIRLTGPLSVGSNYESTDVLVVAGDFRCGARCRMPSEVWVQGNASIGEGSQLQALAADGKLVLEAGVSVARWLDSDREMRLGEGCRVGSRATSREAVRLGPGSQVLAAHAPQVTTANWDGWMNAPATAGSPECLEIGPPEGPPLPGESLEAAGIEPTKLARLSSQCWSYLGDFRPRVPIRLKAGLVVKGRCDLAGGSVLEGDVKSHGPLFVGASSVCEGSLVSDSDLQLGPGCRFSGMIHAGGSVLLSSGTRGTVRKSMVAAYAAEDLNVEANVAVAGKLASAGRVVVIEPAQAEEWRIERYVRGSQSVALRTPVRGVSVVGLALACACLAFSQGAPPRLPEQIRTEGLPPIRLELTAYGHHVNRGYGDWRGLGGQLWVRANPRFVPAFFYDSQTRPGGTQQNYAFFSYANWSKWFYTTQGFSYAPARPAESSFFPRKRYDMKGWWKLPPNGNVIVGAGYTRVDWGAPGHGQIFNAGLLYYRRKLVLEGNLFMNRNQPGGLVSGAGSLAVQYGQEGSYWVGLSAGGGRELYRLQLLTPSDVRLASYSTTFFYRKWLSRHFGFVMSFDFQEKLDAYRRAGGAASVFVEF